MTSSTVTAAVQKREASPVGVMWQSRSHFRAVLPASVDVEAFLGTAAGALYASRDPDPKKLTLMRCAESDPDSLITAMMRCAALGHMPGTDEFYLTPRVVKGQPTVLGIEGYRGIVERMYRSGAVAKVVVREVCAKDQFSYIEGVHDKPVHSFGADPDGATGADFFGPQGRRERGAMVGVYAYAILTTGAVSQVVILTRDDWEAARDAGGWKPDDQYSPWNRLDAGKNRPEFKGRSMVWKTAARRLEPWVPTSAEYRREQLRAASAAADQAGMRERVPDLPAVNGQPEDIHEAEVVDEPQAAPKPKGQPAPLKAAHEKLTSLLGRIQLGTPEDEKALIDWVTGRKEGEALTRAQLGQVTTFLADALDAALKRHGGDMDIALAEAGKDIWDQYNAAPGGRDAGEPAGDGDG